MSGTGDHGELIIEIGATTWRELLNAYFQQLAQGFWKRGDLDDLPDISGETTPGQWYYAEDAEAIFYDDGTDWRTILTRARRTLDAVPNEDLLGHDCVVDIDTAASGLDLDLDLDAGDGAAGHKGRLVIVRRVSTSAHTAKVSFTGVDGATEAALPTLRDWIALRSDGAAWHVEIDARQAAAGSELWTGRYWGAAKLYRKRVALSMPNGGAASAPHGITGLADVAGVSGMVNNGSGTFLPLGSPASASLSEFHVLVDASNVVSYSSGNFSAWSGFAIVEYTKT